MHTESAVLTEEKKTLSKHEVFNIEEEKNEVKQAALADLEQLERQKNENRRKKEKTGADLRYRMEEEEEKRAGYLEKMETILKQLHSGAARTQRLLFLHSVHC